MLLELAQKLIPNKLKSFLKPYFRMMFPNKIMALLWITFRCNYKCPYCPYCGMVDYTKDFPKECEKTGEEWIKAFEKLPPTSFYISGGEPFLYKDLPYIINNLPKKHSIIGIVTNASLPIEIYNKVNKNIHLNISFHRDFVKSEDDFINKVVELKKRFHVSVNIVATPENFNFIKNKIKIFDKNKVPYHIDPLVLNANEHFEYEEEYKKLLKKHISLDRTNNLKLEKLKTDIKKCSAGRNYYNITPNGNVFVCSRAMDYFHSPLLEHIKDNSLKLGNIFNGDFKLNKNDFICNLKCVNHCDWDYTSIKVTDKQNK